MSADVQCHATGFGEPVKRPEPLMRRISLNTKAFLRESTGRLFDFYERVGSLGEGAYGDVWLAREIVRKFTPQEHGGRLVAVKRVRKPNPAAGLGEEAADDQALCDFRTEVDLMKSLDHPNICRLLQVYEDVHSLYLVMEHIEGGELFERIDRWGSFSEDVASEVMLQVTSALMYCHKRGVVHRDIKPENILMVDDDASTDSMKVKLIDFGFGSKILQGARMKAKVGTFMYTAPEVLLGSPCDEKVDMWSLGCVLFVLLSGRAPFYGPDCRTQILNASISMEGGTWPTVSKEAKSLVRGLLTVDPAQRLSAREAYDHPWFRERGPQEKKPKRITVIQHLRSLKTFHEQSLFRHVALGVLARQMEESSLHNMHEVFREMDSDGDGIISFAEFKQAWRNLCHTSEDDDEAESSLASELSLADSTDLRTFFNSIDLDCSGEIDYTEFIAACMDRKIKDEEEACWSAFRVFDLDGNGVVTLDELQQVLTSAGMQDAFSQDTIKDLWRHLVGSDIEGDTDCGLERSIDFDHFLAALREVRAESSSSAKACEDGPVASDERGNASPKKTGLALPIASRGSGLELPIPGRSSDHTPLAGASPPTSTVCAGLGLPIPCRRSGAATPSPCTGSSSGMGGGKAATPSTGMAAASLPIARRMEWQSPSWATDASSVDGMPPQIGQQCGGSTGSASQASVGPAFQVASASASPATSVSPARHPRCTASVGASVLGTLGQPGAANLSPQRLPVTTRPLGPPSVSSPGVLLPIVSRNHDSPASSTVASGPALPIASRSHAGSAGRPVTGTNYSAAAGGAGMPIENGTPCSFAFPSAGAGVRLPIGSRSYGSPVPSMVATSTPPIVALPIHSRQAGSVLQSPPSTTSSATAMTVSPGGVFGYPLATEVHVISGR